MEVTCHHQYKVEPCIGGGVTRLIGGKHDESSAAPLRYDFISRYHM